VCVYIYIYIHTHTYIYIYIYMSIHAHSYYVAEEWGNQVSAVSGSMESMELWQSRRSPAAPEASPQLHLTQPGWRPGVSCTGVLTAVDGFWFTVG